MPLVGDNVHVKPAREGLKIPKPGTRSLLGNDGEQVKWSRYWKTMWCQGDLLADGAAFAPKTEHKARGRGVVRVGASPAKKPSKTKSSAEAKE